MSSNNLPYYTNGRKKGCVEVMKDLLEEKGYGYLELKSQNLRDQRPVSQKSRNFTGHSRVSKFPFYLKNGEDLNGQALRSIFFLLP